MELKRFTKKEISSLDRLVMFAVVRPFALRRAPCVRVCVLCSLRPLGTGLQVAYASVRGQRPQEAVPPGVPARSGALPHPGALSSRPLGTRAQGTYRQLRELSCDCVPKAMALTNSSVVIGGPGKASLPSAGSMYPIPSTTLTACCGVRRVAQYVGYNFDEPSAEWKEVIEPNAQPCVLVVGEEVLISITVTDPSTKKATAVVRTRALLSSLHCPFQPAQLRNRLRAWR
jgi:hypothetical protein